MGKVQNTIMGKIQNIIVIKANYFSMQTEVLMVTTPSKYTNRLQDGFTHLRLHSEKASIIQYGQRKCEPAASFV